MPWNRRYLIENYIKASLWLVPFAAMPLYWVLVRVSEATGDWLTRTGRIHPDTSLFAMDASGAQTALSAIITLNASFLVFAFSSLLVAIQVASGQYTPRIIATTLLRDNHIRIIVAVFVFTLLFSVRVQNHIRTSVDQFSLLLAAILGLLSVMLFLYLIDYAARMLRPVSLVARVAERGVAVIASVYPQPTKGPSAPRSTPKGTSAARVVVHKGTSGILLAANLPGLVAEARRSNGAVEIVPQVGDFVAVDEPLFLLFGGAGEIGDDLLRSSAAFGSERTIDQDPTFAFRILVDIALKALSAAINDPTTAVLAIDQLHRLLRAVGMRHLRDEAITDTEGNLRVILRTPNWEDFVHLAFREIRHCGGGSLQIARRLRAMGENLIQTLPEHRHRALRAELGLLDRAIERHFAFPEDLALARIADAQGLGGSERSATGAPIPNA
ncbi:MAG: DUF2254 domain-containing protein [Gammaproteobacteria bacterium]